MDIGNIKKHADLNFEVAQAKKNALEKLRSRQLMAYNERLFTADADTMNLFNSYHALCECCFFIIFILDQSTQGVKSGCFALCGHTCGT